MRGRDAAPPTGTQQFSSWGCKAAILWIFLYVVVIAIEVLSRSMVTRIEWRKRIKKHWRNQPKRAFYKAEENPWRETDHLRQPKPNKQI